MARTVFGVIYFVITVVHRWCFSSWYSNREDKSFFAFWIYLVYFVMLFGFAMGELVLMCMHPSVNSGKFSLAIFGWIFVGLDVLAVFIWFSRGVLSMRGGNYNNNDEQMSEEDEEADGGTDDDSSSGGDDNYERR